MSDVFGVVARPRDVGLPVFQGGADRMEGLDEEAVVADLLQRCRAHPGHHLHRDDDVFGVGDLHAELRVVGTEGTHAERHHIHGATAHAAAVEVFHGGPHFARVHPVVGGPGVYFALGTDVGARLDPGHVRRI